MGNDAVGANSCPYMNIQIGAQGNTPGGYSYPNGYVQSYLLNGAWNPNYNRLTFSMACSTSWPLQTTTSSMGTYIRHHPVTDSTQQGAHYYHLMANAVSANHWYYFTMNAHPEHQVGQSPNINWPNDPEWVNPGSEEGDLTPVHYYDGLTRFYLNPYFQALSSAFNCQFGPMSFSSVSGEPDEDVSTVSGSFDGTSYHLDWAGPKNVTESYAVRYATASMHSNGFSTGTACGGTPSTPGSGYTNVNWTCAISQVPALYVAIRPQPPVVGATGSGVSPIRLSFAVDPMWSTGDQVQVSGVGGNTASNGTFNVVPHTWQFWSYLASTLSNVAVSGGIATITTAASHNLEAGQVVMIYNYNDAAQWSYAPTTAVLTVPSATTFTVATTEPDGTYTGTSTPNLQIWSLPSVDLQGSTGNGAWTSGGTAQATSDKTNFSEVLIPSPNFPCDLNNDGLVNSLDVGLAIQMALGSIACTADLDGNGTCEVVDMQRVANAALGQPCRVGP